MDLKLESRILLTYLNYIWAMFQLYPEFDRYLSYFSTIFQIFPNKLDLNYIVLVTISEQYL